MCGSNVRWKTVPESTGTNTGSTESVIKYIVYRLPAASRESSSDHCHFVPLADDESCPIDDQSDVDRSAVGHDPGVRLPLLCVMAAVAFSPTEHLSHWPLPVILLGDRVNCVVDLPRVTA